jgi:hypothetical protein
MVRMPATFMEVIARAEEARQLNVPDAPLHVAVMDDTGAAADYARELIRRGFVNKTPVEIDADGARLRGQTLALVGRALGEAAQGGILILHNAQALADDGELMDRIILACESRECTVILTGEGKAFDDLLRTRGDLRQHFPLVEGRDNSITLAREEAAKQAVEDLRQAVTEAITLSGDIQPLKPIRLSAPEAKP